LTDNLRDRQDALAEVGLREQQLVGGLLPPEGDFMAIIIDALAGDDTVIVGPTVQKTVWIDAGAGDDRVEIQAGNPILIDRTEYGTRNDTPDSAFLLGGRATLTATQPAPSDSRLTANAVFDLRVGSGTPVTVTLSASATMDNKGPEDLLADLQQALQDAGIEDEVAAGLKGDAVILLMTTQVGAQASLSLTPLSGSAGAVQLGFGTDQSATGEELGSSVTYQDLTLDSPDDVDYYRFRLAAAGDPDAVLTVASISDTDGIRIDLLDSNANLLRSGTDRSLSLEGLGAGEYLLEVRSNRIPTVYDLLFDLGDGQQPAELDLGASSDPVRRDVILGGSGQDILMGGPGEDWIFGGEDNDVLSGGLDRLASDLLFGQEGDDVFQIIPDALPFLTGTEQTFIPTYNDEMFGGEGEDQVLFLGGDLDDLGKPVPDFVSLRYNRFLHRYEFTSLVWDTANQAFMMQTQDVPALVIATRDAPLNGPLTQDAQFRLELDDDERFEVTLTAAETAENQNLQDLLSDLRRALAQAGVSEDLVRVDQDDLRIRLVRKATGAEASIEIRPAAETLIDLGDGSPVTDELGFLAEQRGSGAIPVFTQHYLYYQVHDIEATVINTRSGDDVVRTDPEFKFPNVDSEWGIDLGDYEQRGLISALEIYGGPGVDRLFGGPLNDVIDGGPDADIIVGGSGDDVIIGGGGNDLLFGNTGIVPDDLELVRLGDTTAANDTFSFAAELPALVPGETSSTFDDLVLSFHLGDAADWYVIKTPQALKSFGGAEVAALFESLIRVEALHEVNEKLEPSGDLLSFKLFAAQDSGQGLQPEESFAGVPDYYLLKVINDDPTQDGYYRLNFTSALGDVIDIPADMADLVFQSSSSEDQSVAIPLGDINGDGYADFISSVRDSLGTPIDLIRAPSGVHPASVIASTVATIRLGSGGETLSLKLPAPVTEASRFGSLAILSSPGDLNGDGLADIAVAVSLQPGSPEDLSSRQFLHEGVYILFGRGDWPATVDLVADADVLLGDFNPGVPLFIDSAGNMNGDPFDDLLVSTGGEDPLVQV
jgi:Ca2+-binding RTX toxin-like protein